MNDYRNSCTINYFRFMSVPVVGNIAYLIQIWLLNYSLTKSFFASNKKLSTRGIFFRQISRKFQRIYIRSFRYGYTLQQFKKNELVLDLSSIENPKKMRKRDLYNLMWSLVFCSYVTVRTKGDLEGFLPDNFPTV